MGHAPGWVEIMRIMIMTILRMIRVPTAMLIVLILGLIVMSRVTLVIRPTIRIRFRIVRVVWLRTILVT